MQPIIPPVPKHILEEQLTDDKLLRKTGKADNSIYVVTSADSPAVMQEIGRLRELSFRQAGGGTGLPCDIDEDDTAENGYKQLIVWDSVEKEIVGGYRYIVCDSEYPEHLSTEHYFDFSDLFRKKYLPHTIELGRSFIQPAYQNTKENPKSIFALDNLWDGLGALIVKHPEVKYFFGKVTMYGNYDPKARNILLHFLRRYCPDTENLIAAKNPLILNTDDTHFKSLFTGADYKENYKILGQTVRALGESIPPLINSYLGLSPTMKVFDTALNSDFGNVEETGILITIKDIYPEKAKRHTKWIESKLDKKKLFSKRIMNLKTIALSVASLLASVCAWSQTDAKVEIPFNGNTYVTQTKGLTDAEAPKIISTHSGKIVSWNDKSTVMSLYFKTGAAGKFDLSVKASTKSEAESSELLFSMGNRKYRITVSGPEKTYTVGTFETEQPGYVKIDIRGLKRTGEQFGDISGFTAEGEALGGENHFIPYEKVKDCYWYRRGPSVHMGYKLPEKEDIEYFYSEVTVPKGRDVNGTYFMLTGFREGYMGIQSAVTDKGEKRRTVLFSVWSPFTTDNPNEIPDSLHVKVLAKGETVTAQNFGNEGSGKQSFLQYPWKTGKTYKTLVKVQPDGKGNTIYTGYFCNEKGEWMLLARFLRPKTDTYYKGAHSFLECFKPETSVHTRSVEFKNQWARDKHGLWHEVTDATFTCDGTGLSGVRTDMYGGENNGAFMLQNCGFFDQTTKYRSSFSRPATGNAPQIDFDALEALTK